MDALQLRINKSMDLLDLLDPEWVNKVDVDTLEMHDPTVCVAGQTVGYGTVCVLIQHFHPKDWLDVMWTTYAFSATGDVDWDTLDAAWRKAIVERQSC